MKISGLVERGALIAHTLANAKLLFREEHIGSLEIGKYADLVVINEIYEIYMTVGKAEDRYNQACYNYNYDKWQHCQFGKIHAIPYCLKAVYCAHLLILDK